MTRKDYIMIAERINQKIQQARVLAKYHFDVQEPQEARRWEHTLSRLTELAYILAMDLARDNKAFDKERFLKACGATV